MKILHLVDPGNPGGGAMTMRLLADTVAELPQCQHHVFLLGSQWHLNLAQRCGLDPLGTIAPSHFLPYVRQHCLRRILQTYQTKYGKYDCVHCWSLRAASLSHRALLSHPTIVSCLVGPVLGEFSTFFMGKNWQNARSTFLPASPSVERELSCWGVESPRIHSLPPAVPANVTSDHSRQSLRKRWQVDDQTMVIGLLSDPVNWADSYYGAHIASRMTLASRSCRLLIHPTATRRRLTVSWISRLRRLSGRDVLINEPMLAEPWRILPGMDAVLFTGGQLNNPEHYVVPSRKQLFTGGTRRVRPVSSVMPILWAMAAGIPTVAETNDATVSILTNGETGFLIPTGNVDAVAFHLMQMHDDKTIADQLSDRARQWVTQNRNTRDYARQLLTFYESTVDN